MKTRLLYFIFALFISIGNIWAQKGPYALHKQGAVVDYAMLYGNKLEGYVRISVTDVKEEGGKTTVTTLHQPLNKSKKPSKNAALAGLGDGLMTSISLEDSAYYMTQDQVFGYYKDLQRQGYMLRIPKELNVGDKIDGGTCSLQGKLMWSTITAELSYKNFEVVAKEDLTTPAGTFHCLKITGNISGTYSKMNINDNQTWWVAPDIGIVQLISTYIDKGIVLRAESVTGI